MSYESVENGPLIWLSIEENRVTRSKKYYELSATEAIQADCDIKATNIILQGLPPEVYALVSNHKVAKELWERIQLLMQRNLLTKQERECKLYDEFDKFAYKKGKHYWSKFMTDVKLVWDLHTTNIDQLHAYLGQHEFHANESPRYGSPYQSQQYSTHQSSTPLSITYPSNDYQSSVHHNVYSPSSSIYQLEYAPTVNQQPEFSQPDSDLIVLVFQKVPAGSKKKTGRDPKGNIMILPPVSVEEHIAVQRETKARTILLQCKASQTMEDCNMKFLSVHFTLWSQGGSSYDSRGTSAPTHSAFISAASTNSKMSYADSQNQPPSITFTTASSSADASSNIGKLDLEELDIKWQMAMLSRRSNAISVQSWVTLLGNVQGNSWILKQDHEGEDVEKGAAQVYGMIAGDEDDAAGNATGDDAVNVSGDVSDAAAEFALMGLSSQVQAYKSTLQTLEQQKAWSPPKPGQHWINSSMSSRSKFGLGYGETFGSDEVFDPSAPSIFDTTPEDVVGKPLYDSLRGHWALLPVFQVFKSSSSRPMNTMPHASKQHLFLLAVGSTASVYCWLVLFCDSSVDTMTRRFLGTASPLIYSSNIAVVALRTTTNNQLRNSSNPRKQATINDGRVTLQPIQGRQTSFVAGTTRTYIPGASGSNSGKQRTAIYQELLKVQATRLSSLPMLLNQADDWMLMTLICDELNSAKFALIANLFIMVHMLSLRLGVKAIAENVNLKSVEISDLNASLQEKVLVITALKDDLRKLKGKALVDNDVTKHLSDPEMLKIDAEPITPKVLNKKTAHSAYIKNTQEEATVLRDLLEHVKSKNPLDQSLESACRYAKRIQELLTNISKTCPSINNADGKLVVVTPKNKDKRVRFTEPVTSSGNTNTKTSSSSNLVSNKPMLSST
ncbi:hypothetical protein Tco_0758276 [Tanacetum coccineum]